MNKEYMQKELDKLESISSLFWKANWSIGGNIDYEYNHETVKRIEKYIKDIQEQLGKKCPSCGYIIKEQ